MGVMNTPMTNVPSIQQIADDYPQFNFRSADIFYWSPKNGCVCYIEDQLFDLDGIFQLLHELGHALLGHRYFNSSIHLLKIEAEAWQKATIVAKNYDLVIPQNTIESSLDSYRDWLHRRSVCPECESISVESDTNHYHCFTCGQDWTVPDHQQTRCYRRKLSTLT